MPLWELSFICARSCVGEDDLGEGAAVSRSRTPSFEGGAFRDEVSHQGMHLPSKSKKPPESSGLKRESTASSPATEVSTAVGASLPPMSV